MYAGCLFLGVGFIAASFATRTWHLYLSQGALVGLGVGFVYIPTIPVLSQWFNKRRSLANGITAAGSGVGGLVFAFATGAMIDHMGHKWALRLIGIIVLVVNALSTSFIRDRKAEVRPVQHAFSTALLLRWDVFFLLLWAVISMLGYIALLYSLSDFARSIGLSTEQGTQTIALLNLGTALGRPWIGVASDRYGRFEVASGLTLFCGLWCMVCWIPASNFCVTLLFAIITGAILGVFWVVSDVQSSMLSSG
jgi:MFS family permease